MFDTFFAGNIILSVIIGRIHRLGHGILININKKKCNHNSLGSSTATDSVESSRWGSWKSFSSDVGVLIVGVSPFVLSSLTTGSTCSLLQGFWTSLWHFLCIRSLHWIHLNPCLPNPQMRSLQKAQNARWNQISK